MIEKSTASTALQKTNNKEKRNMEQETEDKVVKPQGNAPLDMSKIDQNIRDAQEKRDMQNAGGDSTETLTTPGKPGRRGLSEEEKAERERVKAEKKAERDAKRAAAKAEKLANQKPAHLTKVQKAIEKLPKMNDVASNLFDYVLSPVNGASMSDVEVLVAHLEAHVRLIRTTQALERNLEPGTAVRIVGGNKRYMGKTGVVTKCQRIRCYVDVPGVDKEVYLFTSEVEPLEVEAESINEVHEVAALNVADTDPDDGQTVVVVEQTPEPEQRTA